MQHTVDSLNAFTEKVKQAFIDKRIKAPVHLCSGNAGQLIDVFEMHDIQPTDFIFGTWRFSWHCLLHGAPEEWVFGEILAGRSMYLMSRDYRLMASSIVGGILPIACGMAMAIKRRGGSERCFAFVGDMASQTGLCHETWLYAQRQGLPLQIVVEDNGLSTETPSKKAWGEEDLRDIVTTYHYTRTAPHVGVGTHISF